MSHAGSRAALRRLLVFFATVYAVQADAVFPLLAQVRVGTATPSQAPMKQKPGQNDFEHIKDIVGLGAQVTVKILCARP